ncbi:GNAT family N-acetyltransferase [Candidatus Acetothermia bacterium]|nr:GNAT family N-acetyltransferase [Candidatus Acetothermia bacterium]MBI3644126.1 GNAT family N-acetyltransferase [Candidatus Acetothermia bacterium]
MEIREAKSNDFEAIWNIFHQVVAKGDTYVFSPDISKEEARSVWMTPIVKTYVASNGDLIVGTYILKPNQPGLGSHVANAAFMVDSLAQGRGIGKTMGKHALNEARRLGYQAMQFNFVVSTNMNAVALWQKLGFQIIGTLPKVFQHKQLGLVDAYVMHRFL